MRVRWLCLAGSLLAPLGSVAQPAAESSPPATVTAAQLLYQVLEPGLEPYTERILATPGHLRIDQGNDNAEGFLLFDRRRGTIYSVSAEERTVLMLEPLPVPLSVPEGLRLAEQASEQPGAPPIAGVQPLEYAFFAGGALCHHAVVAPGLLGDGRRALQEYNRVLAFQQAASLDRIPDDLQTPCDLAAYIYAPGRELAYGLPIRVWDSGGGARQLVDFAAEREVPAAWFELPAGYRQQTLPELMGE